jgi:hypothetical protein
MMKIILPALDLSPEAVDDIIDCITDFLSDKGEKSPGEPEYPYVLRNDFLSAAEQNFFSVLKTTVSDLAIIHIKVGLGDLFDAKSKDPGEFRIYRNKSDRDLVNSWVK